MTVYNFTIKGTINTYTEDDAIDILDCMAQDHNLHNIKIEVIGKDGVMTQ